MEDLNDKLTGENLPATEWNQVPSEIQNVIEKTGQSLSSGDVDQLGKGVAAYAAGGEYYIDSGAADAYVLGVVGSKQSPPVYFDGMKIRFDPTNNNTGASTVNVATLGVKALKRQDGSALSSGDLQSGVEAQFSYRSGAGYFVHSGLINPVASTTVQGKIETATQAEVDAEADSTRAVVSSTLASRLQSFVRTATTSIKGFIEHATQSEVDTGTDGTRAVTPDTLHGGFTISLAATGYIKFPSWLLGFIIQWGENTVSGDSDLVISWPLTYPNAPRQGIAGQGGAFNISQETGASIRTMTTTQATLRNGVATSQTLRWFSVGN